MVGDLVITEVFADFKAPVGGSGVDEGKEWFEIYNASDRPIELEGLRIDHSRPDLDRLKSHVMEAVTIAPGQYFTLGNATADLVPAYIDYGYSADLGDFFNSDGGRLALNCGSTEIDSTGYDTVKEGRSRQLTAATFPDYTLNDDLANWCEAAGSEFEIGNFGTPGSDNDCTPVILGLCNDNGTMRDVVPPMPGQLVITEVMPSPRGDDNVMEWFEAKALADFDLNGLTLDRAGEPANSDTLESPDCITVTTGEYVVFARSADPLLNNLPAGVTVKGVFGFTLVATSATAPPDVTILSGGTVIDAVTWSNATTGASISLDPDLDEDAAANDAESNFCDGTVVYFPGATGGPNDDELGTPGAVNTQCVLLPPAGMCDDGVTIRNINKPAVGDLVITEFLANPAPAPPPNDPPTTDTTKEWFEVKNISAAAFDLNELTVKNPSSAGNVVLSSSCITVQPGGLALFARSNDPTKNAGMDNVDVTFTFTLNDSGVNRAITVLDGATIIDDLTYSVTASAASGLSIQLDPDNLTTAANDVANPTAGVVCQGTTTYGDLTNKGTPRTDNVQCP